MQEVSEIQLPVTAEALEAYSSLTEEPSWLTAARQQALAAYEAAPWPDRAQHLWRYSDPADFEAPEFSMRPSTAPLPPLPDEARSKGVEVMSLAEAAGHGEHGARVEARLGGLVGAGFGRIEAFNTAAFSQGIYLHVPKGVELEEPIHVVFDASDEVGYDARRLLVEVGSGAKAAVVEEHRGGDESGGARVHAVSELYADDNARIEHVISQRIGEGANAHLSQRIRLGRHARALTVVTSFGGRATKVDLGTLMASEGSECETVGLLYGHGRQSFDHHTLHHHTAPHTSSNLDFKAVLAGRSRSAYTGLIGIEKSAPFSEAFQENRNLLLSKKAKAESIPELEIDIDEVQCSHGATVGPVSADELFYFMSRGISEREAIRHIVSGFLEAILEKVPASIASGLRGALDERLREL